MGGIFSFIDGCVSTLNVCKSCTPLALINLILLSLPLDPPSEAVKLKQKGKMASE